MAISKIPRNYYNDTDHRRDKTSEIIVAVNDLLDNPVLPTPGEGDEGKVVKVNSEGGYDLSEDLHTPIIANPDTESTERLDKLTVGNTTYLVNEDVLPTVLKAVRLKVNTIHGSDQNVAIKRLRMKNTLNGDYYQYGGSDTCTCSTGADSSGLIDNGTFGEFMIPSSNLPFYVDVTFADGIDTTQYNEFGMICSAYESATPLSIEVFVSADGEHFVSVGTMTNTPFIYEGYVTLYNFGDVDIKIPNYTSADRGKFLGIDNTDHVVWDNVPKELPTVTSADEGKVLTVDNNGAWELENKSNIIDCLFDLQNNKLTLNDSRFNSFKDVCETIINDPQTLFKGVATNKEFYFRITFIDKFYSADVLTNIQVSISHTEINSLNSIRIYGTTINSVAAQTEITVNVCDIS